MSTSTKPTVKSTAATLAAKLRANAQAYHDGATHGAFTAANRSLWAEAEAAGPRVHRAVLAILRAS